MVNTVDYNKLLEAAGVDGILVTDPYNLRYYSGFRGGEGSLFITRNSHTLITDSRYTEAAGKESAFDIKEHSLSRSETDIVRDILEREQLFSIGFEDRYMRVSTFERYKEKLPEAKWVPLGEVLEQPRRIKNEAELALLRQAEAIGDAAFTDILGIIRPGMTELQLAAELEYSMKRHGAEGFSFDTICASGIHSSMPHAIPDEKEIQYGDFITMDFGCIYQGYCSDMTRTVVVGKANDRQKEIYNLVLKANLSVLSVIGPGQRCKDVDKIARDIISEGGYGECFGHGLGHSVGLYIHEQPALNKRDETLLEPGMIETVEPGIYIPGFGGVRIEDMIVITEDGYENLTHSEKKLIEL